MLRSHLQTPTQDHIQDMLLLCFLKALGVQDNAYVIPILSQEITENLPEIHMGDQLLIVINPDDLNFQILSEQEAKEAEQDPETWDLFKSFTVAEIDNDDITFYIAVY